ncbi:MAG: long-chain fatty acid--CoA ligase [Desulfobacterales bacterium]|nr:long-chain fatty acid--CoA ligase [Desulfobacterales bacterium]MBF0395221.1 long-chain fatty acid--CoA ligase [Desulfobacterales bacterium]
MESKALKESWVRRVKEHPQKTFIISHFDFLGRKNADNLYKVCWYEADQIIRNFVKGLSVLGFKPFDSLAIFSENRPRWIFSCLGAMLSRGVFVPIYPTSKKIDVEWILSNSSAKFVVCGSMQHAEIVIELKSTLVNLNKIILMEPITEKHEDIIGFDELIEIGQKSGISDLEIDEKIDEIQEEDLATIIYTSGTTGKPKGVELTYKNFLAQTPLEKDFDFSENELFFAHLPLCHSFGLSIDLLLAVNIGATLFVADSLETNYIRKNLKLCRPTFMASVPRLWEKIYITIKERVNSQNFIKKFIIKVLKYAAKGMVMNLVKSQVGLDRLKYSATGGGPIDPKLIEYFGELGITLYQGYGLTETAPIIAANTPKFNKTGTVGKPLPNVELKIAKDGELLVKAPQIMRGYHKNPGATSEVIDKEGWFSTGDIAEIDKDGFVKITDRKKELIITSAGKNIAPQPIENEFNTDPYIEIACVIGDRRNFISAIIVPEFDNVRNWLKNNTSEWIEDNEKLINHPKVVELFNERVAIANKNLAKYEQIKKFSVVSNPFSVENGELTPSLKKKRRVIHEKYKDIINSMYNN